MSFFRRAISFETCEMPMHSMKRSVQTQFSLRWIFHLAVAVLCASRLATAADPETSPKKAEDAFEPDRIWTVHITISADEYEAMQPRSSGGGFPGFGGPRPPAQTELDPKREVHRNNFGMDLPLAEGSVVIGDQTFKEVGLRYKGNGTIGDAARTNKKSFKIDLDKFDASAKFRGQKTINLHCGVADPSKCRDTLGYLLYREAKVPAPRTVLAEVWLTVPGKHDRELLGVYTMVEQVDKSFLRDHFGTDKGLLLKPEGVREFEDKGANWDPYNQPYRPKREPNEKEIQRIVEFVRLVQKSSDDDFRAGIESYLDTDAYLRFLATTAFIANPDSFFVLGHNYFLYLHPVTGQFYFIPWDLDRAFANFPILGTNNQQMNLNFLHPYPGAHRLTERVLAIPGMQERYMSLLKELSETCFAREKLLAQVAAIETAMNPLLAKEKKPANPQPGGFGPPGFGKPPALNTFMEMRTASLASQLAGTSKGYTPAGGFGPGTFKVGDMLAGPLMESLDLDKSGGLGKGEWLAIATKLFDTIPKDAQEAASENVIAAALNEMFPKPPEDQPGPPGGFRPGGFLAGPIVRRVDGNKDGRVTRDELMAGAEKLYDEFDKENSGSLDDATFSSLLNALFPPPNLGPGGRPGGPGPGPGGLPPR